MGETAVQKEIYTAIFGLLGLCILALVANQAGNNPVQLRFKRETEAQISDDLEDDFLEIDEDIFDQEAVDDWNSKNTTENDAKWEQLYADLGIDLSNDNDVQMKQRRVNWNRLRERQIPGIHNEMIAEYNKRLSSLEFYNDISGIDYGIVDPEASSNSQEQFKGYSKTAPIINEFVNSFDCKNDGSNLWADGSSSLNLFYMIPQAVPLFTAADKHTSEFINYWNFFMKFVSEFPKNRRTRYNIRLSIGSYGAGAQFAPRGYLYRPTTPWDRMKRFHQKPKMTAGRPSFFNTLRSIITSVPRYGVSSPTVGADCVLIWMFQDVPRDINDFMVPEQFLMVEEIHSMCTVIPVIVAPNAQNSDIWKKFVANIMPGRRSQIAKDPDFSGAFYVNSLSELQNDDLMAHINKYLCLVKNRATCRIYEAAYDIPTSDGAPTEAATEAPSIDRFIDDYDTATEAPTEQSVTTGGATEPFTEEQATTNAGTPKVPVIDSCCGHDGYNSIPYDSELRTCCEGGNVAAYEFEGSDPCLDVDEFVFK